VDVVVVAELTQGQEIILVILLLICEHVQIALQFLVNTFSLTVDLGMVSYQHCQFDP
jgi:hypothetical protein